MGGFYPLQPPLRRHFLVDTQDCFHRGKHMPSITRGFSNGSGNRPGILRRPFAGSLLYRVLSRTSDDRHKTIIILTNFRKLVTAML